MSETGTSTTCTTAKPRYGPIRLPKDWAKRRDSGSRMVRDQIRAAGAFLTSVRKRGAAVAEGVAERLAPELRDGETLPDHALSFDLVGRSVETALDRLLAVDHAYSACMARYNDLTRQSQQVAARKLGPRAKKVRRSIDGWQATLRGLVGRLLSPGWLAGRSGRE